MKTFALLSAVTVLTFSFASAQDKIATDASSKPEAVSSNPKPVPMLSPAIKMQNQQVPQQNSQNATSPTKPPTTTAPASPKSSSDKTIEQYPPVDNKIAVSDPGVPSDKSSTKKTAPADTKSNEKKATTNTGVSPK